MPAIVIFEGENHSILSFPRRRESKPAPVLAEPVEAFNIHTPQTRSIAAFTLASILWLSAVMALGVISLIIYL